MAKIQNWLEEKFPLKTRKNLTKLDISNKKLENALKVERFINLKELNCNGNKITHLEIVDCPHLEEIDCSANILFELKVNNCPQLKRLCAYSNLLTKLDLSQNGKLEELNLDNNSFSSQNLSFLKGLNNLKKVWLGNNIMWRIKHGVYNKFTGSLEFLKGMDKLELCDISNTDINGGIEHLPKRLVDFRCLNNYIDNAKVEVFAKILANEKGNNFSQKFQSYQQKVKIETHIQQIKN